MNAKKYFYALAVFSLVTANSLSHAQADRDKGNDSPEARDDGKRKGPREGDPGASKEGPRDKNPVASVDPADRKKAKIFVAYDKDSSGTVTSDEIANMREGKLSSAQKRQIRDELRRADANKDGVLSVDEFIWMLNHRGDEGARNEGGRRKRDGDEGGNKAEGPRNGDRK